MLAAVFIGTYTGGFCLSCKRFRLHPRTRKSQETSLHIHVDRGAENPLSVTRHNSLTGLSKSLWKKSKFSHFSFTPLRK